MELNLFEKKTASVTYVNDLTNPVVVYCVLAEILNMMRQRCSGVDGRARYVTLSADVAMSGARH